MADTLLAPFDIGDVAFTDAQVLDTPAEGVTVGSLTVAALEGTDPVAVVSNKLRIKAGTTATFQKNHVRGTTLVTRLLGLVFQCRAQAAALGTFGMGWGNGAGSSFQNGHLWRVSGRINFFAPSSEATGPFYSAATEYRVAVVMGGYNTAGVPWRTGESLTNFVHGAAYYIKGGAWPDWTLLYRQRENNAGTNNVPLCALNNAGTTVDFDLLRQQATTQEVTHDPELYQAAPADASTFAHSADCFLEFDFTASGGSGGQLLGIEFRRTDSNNTLRLVRDGGGTTFQLQKVVSGIPTNLGASFTPTSTKLRLWCFGSSIMLWGGFTLRVEVTETAQQAATGLQVLLPYGTLTNLASWPLTGSVYDVFGDEVPLSVTDGGKGGDTATATVIVGPLATPDTFTAVRSGDFLSCALTTSAVVGASHYQWFRYNVIGGLLDPSSEVTAQTTAPTHNFTGLTKEQTYAFTVRAHESTKPRYSPRKGLIFTPGDKQTLT